MNSTEVFVYALAWCCATSISHAQAVVPPTLSRNGALEHLRAGYQAGRVTTNAAEKQVQVDWTAMALMNGTEIPENEWGNPAYQWATASQTFTSRYWPTACCVLDNTSLIVCGKTENGYTYIEQLSLQWPAPMPTIVTNPQTGVASVGIALPTIGTHTQLYSNDVAGKRLVTNICGVRRSTGSSKDVLLQFFDTFDIYVMHLDDKAMTLLASGTSTSGSLGLVPALLTHEQDYIDFGDKIVGPDTGYSYTFGFSNFGSPMVTYDPNYQTLILLDANRDGVIESTLYYTNAQREANGWTTATNFANYWKP